VNLESPFYLMFFEAPLFVTEQREEKSLSGSLSENLKGTSWRP